MVFEMPDEKQIVWTFRQQSGYVAPRPSQDLQRARGPFPANGRLADCSRTRWQIATKCGSRPGSA
jgi:hypothetical protein